MSDLDRMYADRFRDYLGQRRDTSTFTQPDRDRVRRMVTEEFHAPPQGQCVRWDHQGTPAHPAHVR